MESFIAKQSLCFRVNIVFAEGRHKMAMWSSIYTSFNIWLQLHNFGVRSDDVQIDGFVQDCCNFIANTL